MDAGTETPGRFPGTLKKADTESRGGRPRVASSHQQQEDRRKERSCPRASGGSTALPMDFQPSDQWENKYVVFFLKKIIYLFIYFWLCWVFVSVRGLSLVAASGGHSSSWCAGLSLSRPLVAEHRLQTRRLSSCGSQAQLLCGLWDLPRPGLEPVSPALAGRFPTTAPPGKPLSVVFRPPRW